MVGKTSAIEESWSIITGVLREDVVVIGSSLALAAIEESWSIITDVLREDVVVVGSSLALAAIEESWSIITVVLREDVVVVGDNLALAVAVAKSKASDDICLAVEMETNIGLLTSICQLLH